MSQIPISQAQVDSIWREVWKDTGNDQEKLLKNRLFSEIYGVMRKFVPVGTSTILEVGGGTGRFGVALARDYPEARVVISDILPEAGIIARNLSDHLRLKNVEVRTQDLFSLESRELFDVVISDAVIQHVAEDKEAIRKMASVIRPGGRLIVAVVNKWNFHSLYKVILQLFGGEYEYGYEKSYSPSSLHALLAQAGLVPLGVRGVYTVYGLRRLARKWPWLSALSRLADIFCRFCDKLTRHRATDIFGFEIIVAGEKHAN